MGAAGNLAKSDTKKETVIIVTASREPGKENAV